MPHSLSANRQQQQSIQGMIVCLLVVVGVLVLSAVLTDDHRADDDNSDDDKCEMLNIFAGKCFQLVQAQPHWSVHVCSRADIWCVAVNA